MESTLQKIKAVAEAVYWYFHRTVDAFSQLFNVVVLLGQNANESTSGRSFREYQVNKKRRWMILYNFINAIFFWEKDHCEASYVADVQRAVVLLEEDKLR